MDALLNGVRLHYSDRGDPAKPPVVLIHGFPFSERMWDPQVEALGRNYRVITYDNRGHGTTEAGDGQYLVEFLVDDLLALLDHLKIEKAVLVGLSMGGYIALRAIERNPERVRALILCDTRSEADTNEAKINRAAAIRKVKTQGVPAFAAGFLKALFSPESFERNPAAVDKIRKIIESNPPLGMAGTQIALASRTDTTAALPKISVPTLILVGEKDPITPPAAAQAMKDKIPGAELQVIPGAAHLSNLENPAEFNKHLLAFLKRL